MPRTRTNPCLLVTSLLCACLCGGDVSANSDADPWTERVRIAVEDAACVRNGFARDRVDVTLHRLHVPDEYRAATGIRIALPDYDDAIGPMTAHATFTAKGKTLGRMPVPVRVSVFADVLVTKTRLARHAIVQPGDVGRQTLEITKRVKWAMTDADSVVGQRTKRTINPGQIVDRRWLADVPLIQRGDRVTMAYAKGAVRVTAHVTAMEDGYRDQQIMVKSAQAKRLLPVVVVDGNTVTPVR